MAAPAVLLLGCPPKDVVRLYQTTPVAPSLDDGAVAALDHLGVTVVDDGVNFSVFSGNAQRLDLLLFDDPEAERPTRQFEMSRFGDVWNLHVEGVGLGQHYGYVAWGPNWPFHPDWSPGRIEGFVADVDAVGHRFNPNKLLIDPYARAVHRDHDWSKGSVASGPARTESTWAAAAKAVVVQSNYVWSDEEALWRAGRQSTSFSGHGWEDLIVYEVHPKGFTADPASGVDFPGTFRGFGEMADYLADLGITAVELMPVHEKPLDGGYWGYNSLLFFAPELSFGVTTRPGEVADEFKWMVDQLHLRGIEVILDVVFNHTGEGGLWREKLELTDTELDPGTGVALANFDPKEVAGLYTFRGLDNVSYYALDSSDPGFYVNNTGVGNMTRVNYRPVRRLTLDALRFWVEEMHVDGFRFDLAPIHGEKDRDYSRWDVIEETSLQDIIEDPILQQYNTRIMAEPWAVSGFYLGDFPKDRNSDVAWYEWNGHFRDWWRSFVNDDNWALNAREGAVDGGGVLTGSFDLFDDEGRKPYHSLNFVTVHDGFTMYDLFSYDQKQNACGPLNPVCCDAPLSPFCDRNSGEDNNRSRDWGQANEATKREQMRNLFVAMMISHGTPLLLGGDEWMRTQLGNNNAYSTRADNPFNWFQWGTWRASEERSRMHDFVRQTIALRKQNAHAFAPAGYGTGAPFSWKAADNTEPPNWSGKHLAIHYYDSSAGAELEVLINMESGPVDFTLPSGRTWKRLVDTQQWFDGDTYLEQEGLNKGATANVTLAAPADVPGPIYQVQPRSIVVLRAQ